MIKKGKRQNGPQQASAVPILYEIINLLSCRGRREMGNRLVEKKVVYYCVSDVSAICLMFHSIKKVEKEKGKVKKRREPTFFTTVTTNVVKIDSSSPDA